MTVNFVITDERKDVISSLQMTLTAIQLAHDNTIYWKWVVLALHSSLQGAMVCHLNRSDGLGAIKDGDVRKWYEWYNSGRNGQEPKTRLALPTDLFKWISDPNRTPNSVIWKPISTSTSRQKAFTLLHELRNSFTHFQPASWSIEIAGLPNMTSEIISIIDQINQVGWAFFELDNTDKERLHENIKALKSHVP